MTDTDLPTVTLGGQQWKLPHLVIKQLRLVRSKIISLTNALKETEDENSGEKYFNLSDDQFSDMLDVVYHGLTRADPTLTREQFEELTGDNVEVFRAYLAVRSQSGVYVMAKPGAPPGEAGAARDQS